MFAVRVVGYAGSVASEAEGGVAAGHYFVGGAAQGGVWRYECSEGAGAAGAPAPAPALRRISHLTPLPAPTTGTPTIGAPTTVRRAWIIPTICRTHPRGAYIPIPKHGEALVGCWLLVECGDGLLRTGRVDSVSTSVRGNPQGAMCELREVRSWIVGVGEGEEGRLGLGMEGEGEEGEGELATAAAAAPHSFSVLDSKVTELSLPVKILFDCGGPRGLHLKKSI